MEKPTYDELVAQLRRNNDYLRQYYGSNAGELSVQERIRLEDLVERNSVFIIKASKK